MNLDKSAACIRRRHCNVVNKESATTSAGNKIKEENKRPETKMQMTIISFEKGEKKVQNIDDPDEKEEEQKLTTEDTTDDQSDDIPDELAEVTPLPANAPGRTEKIEKLMRHVLEEGWRVISFHHLPDWLKDNDFLRNYHRPPMPSFRCCFKSIFRIHTETGNIWTHLLGFVAFLVITVLFLTHPSSGFTWQEQAVFMAFFLGAILCLGLSFVFHTVYCHSKSVSRLFSKLDYSGISLLIVGSFIPWLYYSFYCEHVARYAYIILISVLGVAAIFVSLWDKFSTPKFRPLRAGVFIAMGLSAVIPAVHFFIQTGFPSAFEAGAVGWMALMATMYITGAILYAVRVPERFFPGKCDIVFQSHQIFHVLVVAAAFVHYHGISNMAGYRFAIGECLDEE
ncbi:adiponectin receptor protein 1-like isoform X2 [Ptychodera flava]|uniref:adiponectin receptor protein 1-like isoform X2 n=1 Tax=Ptychodera flava TaxID=63121 RepID=UPI00396A2189